MYPLRLELATFRVLVVCLDNTTASTADKLSLKVINTHQIYMYGI